MLKREQGATLIELMISLVLSLFLILIVAQFFVANKSSYRTQQAQADVQERGRHAVYWLSQQIRQAGYVDTTRLISLSTINFVASGSFVLSGQVVSGDANAINIRYWGAVDGKLVDCLGRSAVFNVVTSHAIKLENGALTCDGKFIMPGISQLVFEYGIDGTSDGAPEKYSHLVELAGLEVVKAVRVCFVVDSLLNNVSPSPVSIIDCTGGLYTPPLNKLARIFRASVFLRNSGGAVP